MEYQVLTADQQTDILRNNLLQAEADHFVHSLQKDEVQAQLAALPAPPSKGDDPNAAVREQGASKLDGFEQLIKAAEARADVVKLKLDLAGEPLVKPDPVTDEKVDTK